MFGFVDSSLNMFDGLNHEVLMYYMEEEERGPREEKLDGMLLTDYMFQRNFIFSKTGLKNILQTIASILSYPSRRGGGWEPHI